jgi:hypothetical protein
VWPDQVERLDRLRAACALAAEVPAPVERAPAAEWVERRLAEATRGMGYLDERFAHDRPGGRRARRGTRATGERRSPDRENRACQGRRERTGL